MKAIAVTADSGTVRLVDRPEPSITAADQLKLRVVRVGICDTDREEVAGERWRAADGARDLVIGHEMMGQVVEVGEHVTRVRPGDYAVLTVRRECDHCRPCAMNRPDLCRSGEYRERGIWRQDGYQAEYVVDHDRHAVRLPPELQAEGVLTEPLSVAEKALDEAARIQSARLPRAGRRPAFADLRCLVVGLGPIGLLAAMLLRLRRAEVHGYDVVDIGTARPQWLARIGGRYARGRDIPPSRLRQVLGPMDLVMEASGMTEVVCELPRALAPGGLCVLLGIPSRHGHARAPDVDVLRAVVLDNQVIAGSGSAGPDHFGMAVTDLDRARRRWGDHLLHLITDRRPYTEYAAMLRHHPPDEIKAVLQW